MLTGVTRPFHAPHALLHALDLPYDGRSRDLDPKGTRSIHNTILRS